MQHVGTLLETMIEIDEQKLWIAIGCNNDEELGIFLLPITIIDRANNAIIASGQVTITVVNPLGFAAIIGFAAGVFGLCMISKLIDPVSRLFENNYQQSKAAAPDLPLRERISDLYKRVSENVRTLKEPIEEALRPCAWRTAHRVVHLLLGG